jgi:hypothetical protein
MTREDVIQHLCETICHAYHTIGDYRDASDGFCVFCVRGDANRLSRFQNAGFVLDFVRQAVREKLTRDGFDPTIGDDRVLFRITPDQTWPLPPREGTE